ncbi:hypothetical protein FBUS_06564 [Fasciolopsis buskii]|uniref:Uncharacterized protein n=1 Tax=Fasciolopsis buskii TaxID=27845 RepID=A0A8E0S904_9TREM|nr:hypothetical protein FBUS_06564 [Fasciolopsis buski]
MPPKKKAGKEITKKSKRDVQRLTSNEMLLDYRIGLTRSTLTELGFKKAVLTEEIARKEAKLRELSDQSEHDLNETMDKWREFKAAESNDISSTEVVEFMHSNWKVKEDKQNGLRSIENEIERTRVSEQETREQVERWKYFENKTLPSNNEFIGTLRQEISSMKDRYDSFVENINQSFTMNKSKYVDKFLSRLETIRKDLADKAIRKLETHQWEVAEQEEWLRKELDILKERQEELSQKVAQIEKMNIAICDKHAHKNLNSILWPKKIPANFPETDSYLHHSRVLDLDLSEYFNKLELSSGKSLVSGVNVTDLDKEIIPIAVSAGKRQHISKPQIFNFEVTSRSRKDTLLSQKVDSLLKDLTDSSRWNKLMAIRSEEFQLLQVHGLSPCPASSTAI